MTLHNRLLAISAFVGFTILGLSASAFAADWRIVRMSGDVRIHRESAQWVSLNPKQDLDPGDAIWTGKNGRVMISSEDGHILVNPHSMVMIPRQALSSNMNVIFHGFGTVEAVVEKRKHHHFSIQSKYLAAVVKGTRFTVSGDDDQTRLDVEEGLVQAIDIATGKATDVPAGRFLVVARNAQAGAGGGTTVSGGVSTGKPGSAAAGTPGNGKGNKGNGAGNGGGNGTGNEGNGNGNGNGNR